jgi:hypothetical protein
MLIMLSLPPNIPNNFPEHLATECKEWKNSRDPNCQGGMRAEVYYDSTDDSIIGTKTTGCADWMWTNDYSSPLSCVEFYETILNYNSSCSGCVEVKIEYGE